MTLAGCQKRKLNHLARHMQGFIHHLAGAGGDNPRQAAGLGVASEPAPEAGPCWGPPPVCSSPQTPAACLEPPGLCGKGAGSEAGHLTSPSRTGDAPAVGCGRSFTPTAANVPRTGTVSDLKAALHTAGCLQQSQGPPLMGGTFQKLHLDSCSSARRQDTAGC